MNWRFRGNLPDQLIGSVCQNVIAWNMEEWEREKVHAIPISGINMLVATSSIDWHVDDQGPRWTSLLFLMDTMKSRMDANTEEQVFCDPGKMILFDSHRPHRLWVRGTGILVAAVLDWEEKPSKREVNEKYQVMFRQFKRRIVRA